MEPYQQQKLKEIQGQVKEEQARE